MVLEIIPELLLTNVTVNDDSSVNGTLYTGNKFEITQYNHAHHSGVNQVSIKNVNQIQL